MPVITFWSNNEKAIGQTVAASVAATALAMEHNYKVLLVSADLNNNSIENCFGAQQSNKALVSSLVTGNQINLEAGTNGLLKMAQSNRLTPESIKDYTKIIYKNRLEILYSSTNIEIPLETQLGYYKNIILNASKYYDYVVVDLKKGRPVAPILEILDMSNVIVLNTEQGTQTLIEFMRTKELQTYMNNGKILWNLCRYDKKSKYNTKNLTRSIWKQQPVYALPYNTLLFEACNEGGVAELLLRIKTVKTDDENVEMLNEAIKLTEGILQRQKELQMRI